ncbi:hypothetical protein [Phaffia rhodozyma]|uniref:F-box domain n=1 Tax=Phaffia rhodozyma TaxID=264483 RepID=A0A0F7SKZ8_PHARH|nr:hypothetical protein [Phaffia rhodozyma]
MADRSLISDPSIFTSSIPTPSSSPPPPSKPESKRKSTINDLPFELLEPIVKQAIVPGRKSGANVLLVCWTFHELGRRKFYQRVVLSSQKGYDSYFLLGGHLDGWRKEIKLQRLADYRQLETLTLNFATLKKIPIELSGIDPVSGLVLFPKLHTLSLHLALGSSYSSAPPKPLSRRITKLLGTFSPRTFLFDPTSSSEVTLAAITAHHLAHTEFLSIASHQIGHLPRFTPLSVPSLEVVQVRAYPAVSVRDLKYLCEGLVGSDTVVEVVWVKRGQEAWWDREMRLEVEKEVGRARRAGDDWVDSVILLFEGELEEYELEEQAEPDGFPMMF